VSLLLLTFRQHRLRILLVLGSSTASAALNVAVIAFINERLIRDAVRGPALLHFALLLTALLVVSASSQMAMSALGHRVVYGLRRTLVKRVLDTDVERLEAVGLARILASLSADTTHLTIAFNSLPALLYGVALSVGGFGYLASLSPRLAGATLVCLTLTIAVAWQLLKRTHREARQARDAEDRLYEDYQATVEGRKELALNRDRARLVYDEEFDEHAKQNRDHEIRADVFNGLNDNWVNVMVLGAIGVDFFLARALGWADTAIAATYALTLLFLRAPVTSVVNAIPALVSGSVALAKVNELSLAEYKADFGERSIEPLAGFQTIVLDALSYRYQRERQADRRSTLDWALPSARRSHPRGRHPRRRGRRCRVSAAFFERVLRFSSLRAVGWARWGKTVGHRDGPVAGPSRHARKGEHRGRCSH